MQLAADGVEVSARTDRRGRVPRVHTSLIGRDEELAHLTRLLRSSDSLLVSITGRSGSGKTRLALEAAHRVGPDLPGGAIFVDLNTVADISLLATAVAVALDLVVAPGQEPEAVIRRELQFQPSLVVVDDIDSIPAADEWFARLIDELPGTRLVVTAKSPLHMPSERVVRIGPLISGDAGKPDVNDWMSNPAVQLFADRAAAVQYDFKLDRANLRQVVELCLHLDGLPLAIELAAARCTTLSPGAQLRMIERGSALELGPRRGELRDAIALSYDLISAADQHVLSSMSVFEGSASLEAARAVCAPVTAEGDFLDQLATLVDFNLVEADNTSDDPRFGLLPMIREFATEQAITSGEQPDSFARQNDYYVAFAREASKLLEHRQIVALAEERANLEMVLNRLVVAGETVHAARLAADLGWLWERDGWFPVAQRWLDELIAAGEADPTIDPETRALPLIWWVRLSVQHPAAAERAPLIATRQKLALDYARESGQLDTILLALQAIYFSVLITHDFATAVAAAFEGLEIARAANNERWLTRFEIAAGVATNLSGDLATGVGFARSAMARAQRTNDLAATVAPFFMLRDARARGQEVTDRLPSREEFLVVVRELGDVRGEGWVLSGLAAEALRHGDHAAVVHWSIAGLELGRRTGLWDSAGFACNHLAGVANERGDDSAVARMYGTVARIRPVLEVTFSPESLAEYNGMIEQVRERSGPARFDRLAAAAAKLSWDDAVLAALDYARRLAAQMPAQDEADAPVKRVSEADGEVKKLTLREKEVLKLMATGATNNQIATQLNVSTKTVMHHSVSIYAKLGVRGRAEATAWSFRHGLAGAAG
jgi:predicted ATPase/DNA-binding CsgD family transcriptional regulator